MKNLFVLLLSCFALTAFAQLPVSNVYLFDMTIIDTSMTLSEPRFLTADNPNGYNNQPAFLRNGNLLLTVATPRQEQPDVYELNLGRKTKTRLTRTAEGEYSPTPTPDGLHFSAVRVEMDGNNTQRLWQFPLDRQDNGAPVFDVLRGVGYHSWLDRDRVAMFIVAEPNYLLVGDARDGSTKHLTVDIGRCMGRLPDGSLLYVQKATGSTWFLKQLNAVTLDSKTVATTLRGSEDFTILPDGSVLMAKGSKIYRLFLEEDHWREVADLQRFGLTNIKRLANGNGRLAVVNLP